MPELRTCDAPDCEAQVPRGQLMCRAHWYQLPYRLRKAINATWRNRRVGGLRAWSANVLEARSFLAAGDGAQAGGR